MSSYCLIVNKLIKNIWITKSVKIKKMLEIIAIALESLGRFLSANAYVI